MAGSAYRVGLDIGGTAIKAGCVDSAGRVLRETSIDPGFADGPARVLDRLAALARELDPELVSLGVGAPGGVDRARDTLQHCGNLPGFAGVPLRRELAARLTLAPEAISIENDANAAALGELWLGAGRGGSDWMLVTLGTGIGGGLILGGRLHTGGGLASEPGHVVVEPGGLACSCGGRGCVETLASGGAARRRALEAGLPAQAPGDLELLCERARRGPGPEAEFLHAIGRDLGHGLGPIVSLLDLDTFLFGGGFSAAFDTLEAGLRKGVDERSYGGRGRRLRLERASLGPSAGWIGAARLAFPSELSCRP